jgi:hypothetical protein
VVTVASTFPLASLGSGLAASEAPGFALAKAYGDNGFAVAVAAGGVISVTGLIVAEYIALTRLVPAMLGTGGEPPRS